MDGEWPAGVVVLWRDGDGQTLSGIVRSSTEIVHQRATDDDQGTMHRIYTIIRQDGCTVAVSEERLTAIPESLPGSVPAIEQLVKRVIGDDCHVHVICSPDWVEPNYVCVVARKSNGLYFEMAERNGLMHALKRETPTGTRLDVAFAEEVRAT